MDNNESNLLNVFNDFLETADYPVLVNFRRFQEFERGPVVEILKPANSGKIRELEIDINAAENIREHFSLNKSDSCVVFDSGTEHTVHKGIKNVRDYLQVIFQSN